MIAEAMAAVQQGLPEQGNLLDYVRAVLKSRELIKFGVLVVCGLLGMIGNYGYKWLRDETRGGLYDYMFGSYPKRTLLALVAVISWATITIGTPIAEGMGWSALINLGITTGFAFDVVLNKSEKVVWTEEERVAHLGVKPVPSLEVAPAPAPAALPPQS